MKRRSAKCEIVMDAAERASRLAALCRPAFQSLEGYRADIEARFGPTPHFDPCDGASHARLLLLLETPGPGLPEPRFVSRDNPTGTARKIRAFLHQAGIARADTILWNAVPWVIHAPGARNRPPRRSEIDSGLTLLPPLLALLPRLHIVIMAGRVAASAEPVLQRLAPSLRLLHMPHPSPTFVNTAPSVAQRIEAVLAAASAALNAINDSRCRGEPCP